MIAAGVGSWGWIRETRRESVRGGSRAASMRRDGLPDPSPRPDSGGTWLRVMLTLPPSKLPRVGTTIFTVMSRLAQECGAINLSQGFPDFDPPPRLVELVTEAMRSGINQYAPMPGWPALLEAIGAKVRDLYGCEVDPQASVTVTSGATEALFCAVHAVVRPGDEVILLEPAYDSYEPAVELAGGRAVRVPLQPGGLPRGLGPGAGRDHAAHAARHRQLAAQPDGCRVQRGGPRRARGRAARQRGAGAVRRGLRAHRVRRPPAPQPARSTVARRAQFRRLVVRQDAALHRLEGRLLRRAARADHRVPQGAPVRAVRSGRADAGCAGAIPRRMPAARPRAGAVLPAQARPFLPAARAHRVALRAEWRHVLPARRLLDGE